MKQLYGLGDKNRRLTTWRLLGLIISLESESSTSEKSEPVERFAHPVCGPWGGSQKGKVTVTFGWDPVESDTLISTTRSSRAVVWLHSRAALLLIWSAPRQQHGLPLSPWEPSNYLLGWKVTICVCKDSFLSWPVQFPGPCECWIERFLGELRIVSPCDAIIAVLMRHIYDVMASFKQLPGWKQPGAGLERGQSSHHSIVFHIHRRLPHNLFTLVPSALSPSVTTPLWWQLRSIFQSVCVCLKTACACVSLSLSSHECVAANSIFSPRAKRIWLYGTCLSSMCLCSSYAAPW